MTNVQAAGIEALKVLGYVVGIVLLLAALWSTAYSVLGVAKSLGAFPAAFPAAFAQYPDLFTTGATVFATCVLVATALTASVSVARSKR
jgi:hypothetical protein